MYEIAAFGNPLLDITVNITNNDLLLKYDIQDDDQKEISESEMKILYEDIAELHNTVSPGGCAQNTLRVMQWILNKPNSTVFFGSVANDEQGRLLKQLVEEDKVTAKYLIDEDHITGTCVALVKNVHRALIANISAAQYYSKELIAKDPEFLEILRSVKIIYIEACFLPNRLKAANYIDKICTTERKVLAFNLSAAYLFDTDPYSIEYFAKKCHILFGNKTEYIALAKMMKVDRVENLALDLNRSFKTYDYSNNLLRFGKIIVITNGAKSVTCVHSNGSISVEKGTRLPPELIVDTISAGDSFVAGFLSALLLGHDVNICLRWGNWAATQMIQQSGCTIPKYSAIVNVD